MGRIKVEANDWDGILYPVKNRKDKVIICFSGSEGGIKGSCKLSEFLQNNKIPSLAFGLYKTKHTEKNLDKIPIERIEKAIKWLKEAGYKNIGIEALSKGTEYALESALRYPDITMLILKTPSNFISEGLILKAPSNSSCWSYQGKELPYTPYTLRKFNVVSNLLKQKELNILKINTGKKISDESIIPVENVNADILLFSTSADTVWPSKLASEEIVKRLEEKQFSHKYKHINFLHMSHLMFEEVKPKIKWIFKSEKQYPIECAGERKLMGQECINWIENVWGTEC